MPREGRTAMGKTRMPVEGPREGGQRLDHAPRSIAERQGWKARNLNLTGTNPAIIRAKSLANVLPEDDHVVAIEAFLFESLAHLEVFKTEYPKMHWGFER